MKKVDLAHEKELEARIKEYEVKAKLEAEMNDEVLVARIQVEINARNAMIAFIGELLTALEPFDGRVVNKKITEELMKTFDIRGEVRDSDGFAPYLRSAHMRVNSRRYDDFDEEHTTYKALYRVSASCMPNVSIKCRKFDRVWDETAKTFSEQIVPNWIGADDFFRNYELQIFTTVIGSTDRYSHYATSMKLADEVSRLEGQICTLKPFTDIKELKAVKTKHAELKKAFNDYHGSVNYKVREVLDLRD